LQKRYFNFITFLLIFYFLSPSSILHGQIIFKGIPQYQLPVNASDIYGLSQTRRIINLNGKWTVKNVESDLNSLSISIPSEFEGSGNLIFERTFPLTENDINGHTLLLHFLGVNYSAEFSLNNNIIYRHLGGAFPFSFELPKDLIKNGNDNVLKVNLKYNLSDNTIPFKQRIYFPKSFGGIFRDVFISVQPNNYLDDINFNTIADKKNNSTELNFTSKFFSNDSSSNNNYSIKINLKSSDGKQSIDLPVTNFNYDLNSVSIINNSFKLSSPIFWTQDYPTYYYATVQLISKNGIVDEVKQKVAILSLTNVKNQIELNQSPFLINGVTYIPSFGQNGEFASYNQMEEDIKIIKETGFNTVRFAKMIPHPYLIELCMKYGLLAFIELPINNIPSHFAGNFNYSSKIENYLRTYLKEYKHYNNVVAFGLGSGYTNGNENQNSLLSNLAAIVKGETSFLTYASFSNFEIKSINNLDLYGVELFNNSLEDKIKNLDDLYKNINSSKVFISQATYTINSGHSNGYTNPFTYEAQAKYFSDLISSYKKPSNLGYFINSMFDYTGDYSSLTSGYSKNNLYNIGLISLDKKTKTMAYKVIYSKFHNSERVTIPIGNKIDRSPMLFIIFGLLLALGMGILVNSGKKFREDSSRALLRPYNFFADVRDLRMISGFHTGLLAIILAGTNSLVLSNLLFYFKTDFVFEKLLVSFGNPGIIRDISYLAWNPLMSIIWLTILTTIIFILLMGIIKLFSFVIKTRVFISSIYFTVIWSFLPFALLIPVGIVLFRILNSEISNLNNYIYASIILFFVWTIHRLLKGVYVIFDINPGKVYFYSILTFLVIFGGFLLYYQLKYSLFYFLAILFN